jgi:predicted unusual protein kinase regulating ubiquinone biosynthesis (AarF/ABC1/UbiB family)
MSARGRRLIWAGLRSAGQLVGARLRPGGQDTPWAAIGAQWFDTLSDMKGAAMKLGQLASQYGDLLPPGLAEPLARLQREALPRPWAEMEAVLAAEWSPAQRGQWQSIDPRPLAAASIGQVHRARRAADGSDWVIKIRYPGVAEAVDEDIAALGRLLRMGRLLKIDGPALEALLSELRARLREETDYRCEGANLEQLRARVAHPEVRYPEADPSLSTSAVLVTRYCPAPSLADAKGFPQAIRDQLGTTLLDWALLQALEVGVVHADPHPGNFGFHADGRLTVYDHGCVKQLAPVWPQRLRQALRAACIEDLPALHEALHALGALRTDWDQPAARAAALTGLRPLYAALRQAVLAPLLAQPCYDFSDGRIIDDTRAVVRQELRRLLGDFRPIPELAFVGRALSGHYWMLRGLGARVPVAELLARRIGGLADHARID